MLPDIKRDGKKHVRLPHSPVYFQPIASIFWVVSGEIGKTIDKKEVLWELRLWAVKWS